MKTNEEKNAERRAKRAAAKAALTATTILAQDDTTADEPQTGSTVEEQTLMAQAGSTMAEAVIPQAEPTPEATVVAEAPKRGVGRPRVNPAPAPRPTFNMNVGIVDGRYVIKHDGLVVARTIGTEFVDETMLRAVLVRYAKGYPWQTVSHDLKLGLYKAEGGLSF